MLNNYFTKIYLINLDRRLDRLDRVKQRCSDIGISFERVTAVDGLKLECQITRAKSGIAPCYWNLSALGLVLTFRNIIKESIASNVESILILEDDVFFHNEFTILTRQWIPMIPKNWETIYFGALHIEPFQMINDHIGKITKAYHTHCWALNQSIFDNCLKLTADLSDPLDVIMANEIHSRGRSYCFKINLAYQEANHSDILNTYVNAKL